jgi:NAD(P)-dependent dehydrogenase (short-subunit alcohol dehydrogenase family)
LARWRRALARAGHTVYASMRETKGRNAPQVADVEKFAAENGGDLRAIEMDAASEQSCDAAIQEIVAKNKRLDVVIHNAGHMMFGPAEAFTPDQLAELYDVNVLSTQRVNRAALPVLRKQRNGLVVWVSSSSAAGGTPPYLAPYFAAKAGMDAMAVIYARELARLGDRDVDHRAGRISRRAQIILQTRARRTTKRGRRNTRPWVHTQDSASKCRKLLPRWFRKTRMCRP